MKPHSFTLLLVALTALTTLPNVATAQALASPKSAEMHTVRLEVKFAEAPADKVNTWNQSIASGKNTAREMLTHLTTAGTTMTEIVLTMNMVQDVPVSTSQTDTFPFMTTAGGKSQTNYLPNTKAVSATPHFNEDGTLRLNMSIQRSAILLFDTPPNVTMQSMTTLRTFESGVTLALGDFVPGEKEAKPGKTPAGGTEMLVFVTATVLPDAAQKPKAIR